MDASAQRQGSRVRFAEEEPGLEVFEAPKGLDGAEKGRASSEARAGVGAASAPEVYWAPDGDDNDPDNAKYTFYREGTPTPPEYEDGHGEKAGFGHSRGSHGAVPVLTAAAIARAATARASLPGNGNASPTYNPGGMEEGSQDGEPQSATRKRWTLLIGIALLLIAIPIAIGVGLGVGLRNQALGGSSPGTAAGAVSSRFVPSRHPHLLCMPGYPDLQLTSRCSSSAAGTIPNPTATSGTNVAPSPSTTPPTKSTGTSSSRANPTATGAIPNLDCPSANNTLYTAPGMTKTFLHVCGIDYSGANGATDLSHVVTSSMAECMNVCASLDKCTGCGWGFVADDPVGATSHRCWVKSSLRVSHAARDDYCFGILQS
ncbi:hypothetical protein B0T14DRAFT_48292 [Immersiella caudata]|uniref:Apple domain-containing protein n=1 Tax=Immersiella caudata TaxID=314043 RepID=A0AA39XGK6_9PEZI|nr:hypothetical protein B0T14DRAFT_48292 [Immersiella caudata]